MGVGNRVATKPRSSSLRACHPAPQVKESIRAIEQNLERALGMDLSKFTYQLGAELQYDAKAEKFASNPQADALLTRSYRKPFVVLRQV